MRKRILFVASLLILFVLWGFFSCSEPSKVTERSVGKELSGFRLDEVKRSFEADQAAMPQSRSVVFDQEQILFPEGITPVWDSVRYYSGEKLLEASVPFGTRYEYRLLRWDDGDPQLSEMPSRLVVVKDPATGETASCLRFLLPDADRGVGSDYSGLVLHTTLSGDPILAAKYKNGVLSGAASLQDDARSWEEKAAEMGDLLRGVEVARIRPKIATRGTDDNNLIDSVTIVGHKPIVIRLPLYWFVFDFSGSDGTGGLLDNPGGGGGTGNSSAQPYPDNQKIKVDNKTKPILDSIVRDCMGQLLINGINRNVQITSGFLTPGSRVITHLLKLPDGTSILDYYEVQIGLRCDPISVMEELIHIYQGLGTADFGAAMNNEVEAKLAWFMYWKRTQQIYDIESAIGGKSNMKNFEIMRANFFEGDMNNPAFFDAYKRAVDVFRTNKTYGDEEHYPFDPKQMNLKKLHELMKDCLH